MVKRFDPGRPVESFKSVLLGLVKGYTFDVAAIRARSDTSDALW